jgi:adenosine deaminase
MERLPKIDLHRHIDGSVRLETIFEVGKSLDLGLPGHTIDDLRPHVVVSEPQPGLMAFLAKFEWMVGILANAEICRRVAYECVEDAKREGIDYIELRFSPAFMAGPHGLEQEAVCEAVVDGVAAASHEFGVECRLIGILSRTFGVDACARELEALLSISDKLVAVDLAGDEGRFPPGWFIPHFKRVRDAGLGVTIHAGEAAGPESIRSAIDDLGATRIGHGVRALEDLALMDLLLARRIGIECNLTSNLQTSTVPSLQAHPLKEFLNRGLLATINTDDPGISAIDLTHELEVAAPEAGLNDSEVLQARKNAVEIAFDYAS